MTTLRLSTTNARAWDEQAIDGRGVDLPEPLRRSWSRSRRAGVDPARRGDPGARVHGTALEERRSEPLIARVIAETEAILVTATPEIETECRLGVAAPDGLLVATFGGGEFGRRADAVGFRAGRHWSEGERGTNGIGTAIAEDAVVLARSAAHVERQLHQLASVGVPVRTERGELAAVLGLLMPRDLAGAKPARPLRIAARAIERHRAEGHRLVMATTSPLVFVKPFADRLGFDDVVATQWERTPDGEAFTGRMEGDFVWGRSKSDAVIRWAERHGVALSASWAYSDSYFDAPLLAAVGHPVVVNPDAQLRLTATLQGWPVTHFDRPDGVAKVAGRELQEWGRPFVRPEILAPNARIEFSGIEHIPASGPAIVVFNHRSYFDPTVMALVIAKAGRNVRGLGKKEVFDVPIVGRILKASGGIRVERGTGSDEPLDAAISAVEAGERLGFLPGDLAQKIDPYLRPMYDALYELLGFDQVARLMERQVIEVAPLAYMRGRSLNEAFIILDEAQNTTVEQMKMFLTRIGLGSTAVVNGDVTQVDLPRGQPSGLRHATRILEGVEGVHSVRFQSEDVVRHPLVQRIVEAYAVDDETDGARKGA